MQKHNIPPIFDSDSRILILGSFPSVKSREAEFFYAHPQNRFWHIMERLFDVKLDSVDKKKVFLHEKHIAMWDVISFCDIKGSSDTSIANVVPNDIKRILSSTKVSRIFINGGKAKALYMKHIYPSTEVLPIQLPSTSPANASWSFDRLLDEWKVVKEYLETE